ncbi:hypothetical protein EKN07_06175 [Actinobaculum sp. 352]|nr:hypothetical protein EKN07_06175 [Actinobaculum sp. 352]
MTTAAKEGDEKALLVHLQARIAQAVEDPGTPPRDLSSLSRRLMEITKELKALEVAEAKEAAHVSTQDAAFDSEAI